MNKTLAKAIINFLGIGFIALGIAAFFLNTKIIVGAAVFILAGVAILFRKAFVVYIILFTGFAAAGTGFIIAGLAVADILHRNYKFDMLLIGLVPVALFALIYYFFSRREVSEEFGLSKISILDKFNKEELIACVRVLLWIVGIIGAVLLACYLGVRFLAR